MKYSTGRGTKVKHSTAMEWEEWEKKKRHPWLRYATSKEATVRHATGTVFDLESPGDLDGERERLWVACPRCHIRSLRRVIVKSGCYVCGWNGPEEELPPAFAKDDPTSRFYQNDEEQVKRGRLGVPVSSGLRSKGPETEADKYKAAFMRELTKKHRP